MSEVPSARCCSSVYIGRERVSEPLGDWMEGKMVYSGLKKRKWQRSGIDCSYPEGWCDRDTISQLVFNKST